MKHILIVDDERGSRESLRMVFGKDYELSLAPDAAQARDVMKDRSIDLVLLDVNMPGQDGVTFLKELSDLYPNTPVIMISASTNVRPVVESIRSGAFDFVTKPFDVSDLRRMVERALRNSTLQRCVRALQSDVSRQFPLNGIIGESGIFRDVLEQTKRAAASDATVLITGESGTGKEMLARQIHAWSVRHDEPFVAVHCGSLPETLMESELFGHEKGAFTHADRRRAGRFELAGSGTLFFDEVSEMSLVTQVKLLRVLQEREFMRVGGTQVIKTNARIVAATNRNLKAEMDEGRFREDLFYRMNVVPLAIPPLRDRKEDVSLLARYYLMYFKQSMNISTEDLEPETISLLEQYDWPGNIRELRNIIERILVLHGNQKTLSPEALPGEFHRYGPITGGDVTVQTQPPVSGDQSLADAVNSYERELVLDALRRAGGVQTRAARLLGTTRRILKYKMDKLNIRDRDVQTS